MRMTGDDRCMMILCVDDSSADVRVLQEALKEVGVRSRFLIARDGVEALELLRPCDDRETVKRPDLILLDLNLPGKDGRQFLAEIKANPVLRSIPVVVLTASASGPSTLSPARAPVAGAW